MLLPDRLESSIRVAVVDAKEQSRRALKAFLSTFRDIEVIAGANTLPEAVAMAGRFRPDVILIGDLQPAIRIIQAVAEIKQCCSGTAILVMTTRDELTSEVRAAGADAFLVKGSSPNELVSMIRNIALKSSSQLEQKLEE